MTLFDLETQRERLRGQTHNRCGYCCAHQDYIPWILEIDHIQPKAKGGRDDEENLWLACHTCNLYKSSQTHGRDPITGRRIKLFNPRTQKWQQHFAWSEDGSHIIGRTVCGRATVIALNLNNLISVTVRRNWVKAGWHPPKDL